MLSNDNGESVIAFYDDRRKWIDALSVNPDVGHAAFRIGFWLAKRMNGRDQSTWWSVPRIAREMGVSTRTVSDATGALERLGLMLVVRSPGKPNCYFIRFPWR